MRIHTVLTIIIFQKDVYRFINNLKLFEYNEWSDDFMYRLDYNCTYRMYFKIGIFVILFFINFINIIEKLPKNKTNLNRNSVVEIKKSK